MKKDEIRCLNGQIRVAEAKDVDKTTALTSAQDELAAVTEERSRVKLQIDDLQVRWNTKKFN